MHEQVRTIFLQLVCHIRMRDLFRADLAKRQWHLLGFLLPCCSYVLFTMKFCAYCSASICQCGCGSNRCDMNETKLQRRSLQRNFGLMESACVGGAHAAVAGVGANCHGKISFCNGDSRCYVRSSCCYYSLSIT